MQTAMQNTDRVIVEMDIASRYSYVIEKPIVRVEILDLETGLHANGNARCTPDDDWDEDFGISLATTRATKRLCNKQEKYLIRSTS